MLRLAEREEGGERGRERGRERERERATERESETESMPQRAPAVRNPEPDTLHRKPYTLHPRSDARQ